MAAEQPGGTFQAGPCIRRPGQGKIGEGRAVLMPQPRRGAGFGLGQPP
jgi:hypothetical protein